MSELSHYEKTGYLHDDFKIFHLKDTSMRPIDFHYHDFHKILIFPDTTWMPVMIPTISHSA